MSTFGEEIRRERELRQISLREIAESTKISLRYLDALEQNDFKHLPGGVFNKGFVRAFAEHIGIDPEAMVNAYLLEEQSQLDRAGNGPDPLVLRRGARPTPPPGTDSTPRRRRVAIGIVATVVVVALAIAGFFTIRAWLNRTPTAGAPSQAPATGERP